MIRILIIIGVFLITIGLGAQEHFPKNNGVKENNENYTVFINARIFITPRQIINNGTLLIQKGKVVDGREISLETHQTELWKRYSNKYGLE
jgi:hypothetical protein